MGPHRSAYSALQEHMKGLLPQMPPKNPSEYQRLLDELSELKKDFKNLKHPKSYREHVLRDIRKIEDTLEIPDNKKVKVNE